MTTATKPVEQRPLLVVTRPDTTVPQWVREWAGGRPDVVAADAAAVAASAVGRTLGGPLLLLRPGRADAPRSVVAAVQEHDADTPVLEAAVSAAECCGATLRVVHAVPRSFGERSVGLAAAVDRGRRLVGAAVAATPASGELVRAWPHEVLDETLDADLLVVGGPRPNGTGELGLTARAALLHAPCPVLIVPRAADAGVSGDRLGRVEPQVTA